MTDDEVRARIASVPKWYHPIEVRPGIITPGTNDARTVLKTLDLPSDCRGMRALDLGTRDGFFAFELEQRGAEVVAVDYVAMEESGFAVAAELLGSRVTYFQRNLYELTAADFGTFDIVLFLGLLYHLPDPLGALRIVRQLTRHRMYLETLVLDFGPETDELPLMRLFTGSSWAGDPTNYWGPNVPCVEEMLGEVAFAVRRVIRRGDRCVFACEAAPRSDARHERETTAAGHPPKEVSFELAALRNRQPAGTRASTAGSPEAPLPAATRVFTIVARNYLAYARVLAASLDRHNPGVRLDVVILDDPEHRIPPEPSFEIIRPDALPFVPPEELYTMAAIYDLTELATAVKPWAFQYLFDRGATVAIYLDPDIEVFDSLGPLEPLAREHGILLTPHITEPLPQDGKRPDERDLLLAGTYNLGFMALSAEGAKTFLPWWRERLRRNCLNDPAGGLFVDQHWVDFAPALFEPWILKDPGYNVAYWNLSHRALTREGEHIQVNGRALRFFHYSGFSPRVPHLLSKHQHASLRIRLSEGPLLAELCQRYAAALEEAGFAGCCDVPYGFAETAGGLPLDARTRKVLRRTYLEDEVGGRPPSFPNPFSPDGAGDVVERLLRPSPHAPRIPAYLGEIWSERVDLRIAFPRIESADAERFLHWVRTQGVREHDIPPPLVPPATPAAGALSAHGRKLPPGVNVYGYAFAESGTGQIVRSVVAALAAEGIPYAVVPFTRTISRQQRLFDDLGTASPRFDTNLICINADQVPLFFESMGGQLLPAARNIGLWAWEVEDLPPAMAASEDYLDEVWGISSFTAAALARRLRKPVRTFPLPVVVPEVRRRSRAELGMPAGFLFLFCFDYDSVFRRKNPLAAVAAFRQAFPTDAGAVLYIKTTNAERHAAEDEMLRAAAGSRANIVIRDAYVTHDDYFSMIDACDCYVSLHRSEGFGLTVAEAMALGKPVITTAWSATLELADESNSFPVPARIVEVGDDAPPYPSHSHWADPDVAAAAEQMARVYRDRGGAAAVGARARADIATLHSAPARGPLLCRLLDESRSAPDTSAARARAADALGAVPPSSRPSSWRPSLPSPIRRLLTPLRRLVLRCIHLATSKQ